MNVYRNIHWNPVPMHAAFELYYYYYSFSIFFHRKSSIISRVEYYTFSYTSYTAVKTS